MSKEKKIVERIPEDSIEFRSGIFVLTILSLAASCLFVKTPIAFTALFIWAATTGSYVSYRYRSEKNTWVAWIIVPGTLLVSGNCLFEILNAYAYGPLAWLVPIVHQISGMLALHTFEMKSRSELNTAALLSLLLLCICAPVARGINFGACVLVYISIGALVLYFDNRSLTLRTAPSGLSGVPKRTENLRNYNPESKPSFGKDALVVFLLPLVSIVAFMFVPRNDFLFDWLSSQGKKVTDNLNLADLLKLSTTKGENLKLGSGALAYLPIKPKLLPGDPKNDIKANGKVDESTDKSKKNEKKRPPEKPKKPNSPPQGKPPEKPKKEKPPEKPKKEKPPEKPKKEKPPEKPKKEKPPEKPNKEKPPEKLNKEKPPEKLNKEKPPEKLNKEKPPEKLNKEKPPEKLNKEKPPEKLNKEKPPEKLNKEKPPEKLNKEKPPEKLNKEKPPEQKPQKEKSPEEKPKKEKSPENQKKENPHPEQAKKESPTSEQAKKKNPATEKSKKENSPPQKSKADKQNPPNGKTETSSAAAAKPNIKSATGGKQNSEGKAEKPKDGAKKVDKEKAGPEKGGKEKVQEKKADKPKEALADKPGATSKLDTKTQMPDQNELMFKVSGNRTMYSRQDCFDFFDGQVWSTSDQETKKTFIKPDKGLYDFSKCDLLMTEKSLPSVSVILQYSVQSDLGTLMPAGGLVQKLDYKGDSLTVDVYRRLITQQPLTKGTKYKVFSQLPVYDQKIMRATKLLDSQGEKRITDDLVDYLQVPKNEDERVVEMAHKLTDNQGNWFRKCELITHYLRKTFAYTVEKSEVAEKVNTVDDFLLERKKGDCKDFASAFVVLTRMSGIPCRCVSGYAPGTANAISGQMEVHRSDSHIWGEAYIPGYDWVPFDATPAGYLPDRPPEDNFSISSIQKKLHQEDPLSAERRELQSFWQRIKPHLPLIVGGTIALALVITGLVIGIRRFLAWRRDKAGHPSKRIYRQVMQSLKKAKLIKLPSETSTEFVQRMKASVDKEAARSILIDESLTALITQFLDTYAAVYFGDEPKMSELQELGTSVVAEVQERRKR